MYLIFILLFSFSSFAATTLHESPKWIRLLHYKKNIFGNYVSQADGNSFFLHEKGKTSPEQELKKSIEVFGETLTPGNDHPICRFPLRYKWLNEQLGMPWKATFSGCTNYIEFFSKLAAKRASIIFSSYYLTNPNTAFGHTLLRLSRYDDRNETEMLDYGINYAAIPDETNPFLYAVKGLFGGFRGEFAAVPYYYKVREYSDFEFRDIWSYDLKFSMREVLEMVDHIWELGSTYFDYYYFNENCSYHLLSILEVARPSLDLTSHYTVYSIPADTIRLLEQEDLIEKGKRRESTYSRLIRLSRNLKEDELKTAKDIANHPGNVKNLVAGLDNNVSARILDVSMEAFDYFNSDKILKDDLKTKEAKAFILTARAENPVITNTENIELAKESDSPATSHAPTRFTLGEKYYDKQGLSTRFEFRAALHDLLDPPAGSLQEAELEMGKISFEYREKNFKDPVFLFDSVTVLNLKNYPDQNFWSSPYSWEIEVGGRQIRRDDCFDCPGAYLNLSIGNSVSLSEGRVLLAFLLNNGIDVQSYFSNNYRYGLGPKLFTRFRMSEKWLLGFTSYYHFNTYEHRKLFEDHEWWNGLEMRTHMSDRFSLSLTAEGIERDNIWTNSFGVGLQYFYE